MRVKTFSAHVRFIFDAAVSGKRFSTHERVRETGKSEKMTENNRGNRVKRKIRASRERSKERNLRKPRKERTQSKQKKGAMEITVKRGVGMGRLERELSGDNRGNSVKREIREKREKGQ